MATSSKSKTSYRSKGTAKDKARLVKEVVTNRGGRATMSTRDGVTVRLTVGEHKGLVRWTPEGRFDYPNSNLNGRKVRNVSELLNVIESA